MENYALDTNCFIEAVNTNSPSYEVLKKIFSALKEGKMKLLIGLHTLHELEKKKDKAWELAKTLPELPHWPIGTWDEQVGTWKQATGTWDDIKRNDQIQLRLKLLAKSGNDIRDRGAYLDALCSNLTGFVTSDKQLVGDGPSRRINERFQTRVMSPKELANKLSE